MSFVLFFITLISPGILTVISAISGFICTVLWLLWRKQAGANAEITRIDENLKYRIVDMTKEEYIKLKKSQKDTRDAGILLLVICFPSYLFLILRDPRLVFPFVFGMLSGLILFVRSFAHRIYAPLRFVKFNDENGKTNPYPNRKAHAASVAAEEPEKIIMGYTGNKFDSGKTENNRIIGCLLGGAAGDALGYPVEFIKYDQIIERYGKSGITSYSVDPATAKAIVSDDTQMTLFTAEGLLRQDGDDITSIYRSYQNWLITQTTSFEARPRNNDSELMDCPELFVRRAPGNTCISVLSSGMMGTVTDPINASKGCGGVMRVAPIAFINYYSVFELDKLAARSAAITHGHPLGYLPAALLVHIIHTAIYENADKKDLKQIITGSVTQFSGMFSTAPYLDDLIKLINKAIDLSGNKKSDMENIHDIGEGWVAEETLAIAVYCTLRYQNNFSKALVAAVNHDGDSDSTGAVTGNILGAYLGEAGINAKWKNDLELLDLISKTAADFQS